MGLIQLRVGLRRTRGAANLLFALNAFVVAVYAVCEMALACADSPAQYLAWLRWLDLMAALQVVTTAAFVWVFFGTGRKWLVFLAPGLSCAALIADFMPEPKLVYLHLTGIRKIPTFGGATYTVANGVENPLNALFYLGVLLLLVFVADASITLWRRGAHRRAAVIGGAITFFVLVGGTQAALVDNDILRTPYLLSFAYLAILVAMGLELSHDVLRTVQLTDDLRESETRMKLAAEAAGFGVWMWTLATNRVWASERALRLFGFELGADVTFEQVFERVNPDDCERVKSAVRNSVATGAGYSSEFRVRLPDGTDRWISALGRMNSNGNERTARMLGAVVDITERRSAEAAARNLSGRLIHAQEAERMRIARELHDDLSQSLALLAVELDMLGQKPPATSTKVSERMQELSTQVRNLSSGVHRLSHELHPAKLEQLGLEAAVRGFCKEFGLAHQFAVDLVVHDVPRVLPAEIALCLYRIVQEGLQNVVKHSGATMATVKLTADENEICLEILDEGSGFDSAATSGAGSLGVVGMHERVRLVQGQISIVSHQDEGTRIEVRVPLRSRSGECETKSI
jgi:PAS domain S-box-containing protein